MCRLSYYRRSSVIVVIRPPLGSATLSNSYGPNTKLIGGHSAKRNQRIATNQLRKSILESSQPDIRQTRSVREVHEADANGSNPILAAHLPPPSDNSGTVVPPCDPRDGVVTPLAAAHRGIHALRHTLGENSECPQSITAFPDKRPRSFHQGGFRGSSFFASAPEFPSSRRDAGV